MENYCVFHDSDRDEGDGGGAWWLVVSDGVGVGGVVAPVQLFPGCKDRWRLLPPRLIQALPHQLAVRLLPGPRDAAAGAKVGAGQEGEHAAPYVRRIC